MCNADCLPNSPIHTSTHHKCVCVSVCVCMYVYTGGHIVVHKSLDEVMRDSSTPDHDGDDGGGSGGDGGSNDSMVTAAHTITATISTPPTSSRRRLVFDNQQPQRNDLMQLLTTSDEATSSTPRHVTTASDGGVGRTHTIQVCMCLCGYGMMGVLGSQANVGVASDRLASTSMA